MARPAPKLLEPFRWNGLRVGLLGGSFNPPHQGHVHASLTAMKYLGLDAVWWLVSPGNPLKKGLPLPSLENRIQSCRELARHPGIFISGLEQDLATFRTFQTVSLLKGRFPRTDFIWLAGTDIAYEFDRWYRWRDLMDLVPFAFVGRPTHSGLVRQNVFRGMNHLRNTVLQHGVYPDLNPGQVFWILDEPRNPVSSTELRNLAFTSPKAP